MFTFVQKNTSNTYIFSAVFYYAFDLYIYIHIYIYIYLPRGPMWGVYLDFSTCVSAIFKLRWLRILLNTLTARMCSIGNFPCLGNAGLSVFRIRVCALPFPARKALLRFFFICNICIYPIHLVPLLGLDALRTRVLFVLYVAWCRHYFTYTKKTKINRNKKKGPEQVLLDPKGREAQAVI